MKDLELKLTFSRVSPLSFALTKRQLKVSKSFTVAIQPLSTRLIKVELILKSHIFLKIKETYRSSRQCKWHLWHGAGYNIYQMWRPWYDRVDFGLPNHCTREKLQSVQGTRVQGTRYNLYKREINWSEAMFLRNAIKHYTAEKLLQVKR